MALLWRVLKAIGIVSGFAATYGSLIASGMRFDMWGLAWPYWAMIGFTIFWVSMVIVMIAQYREIRRLRSPEEQLRLEKLEREDRKLRNEQSVQDTGKLT